MQGEKRAPASSYKITIMQGSIAYPYLVPDGTKLHLAFLVSTDVLSLTGQDRLNMKK